MKSTVSIRGMFKALMILFIGASSLCYLFLYRPKIDKSVEGTEEISSLEQKLQGKMKEINTIRSEIERIRRAEPKRRPTRISLRGPALLKKINEEANRLGIRIIMVKPLPEQESPQYVRYPFSVETKSKYGAMVKFIYTLEDTFGLTVDDLHIENDPKNPPWHRFTFTVSSFQFFDRI
jgi:Tfp pilus assembly protein PilO